RDALGRVLYGQGYANDVVAPDVWRIGVAGAVLCRGRADTVGPVGPGIDRARRLLVTTLAKIRRSRVPIGRERWTIADMRAQQLECGTTICRVKKNHRSVAIWACQEPVNKQ